MSKVTKGRITKRRELQNVEKGRKLQKAEKGRKLRYSMWKISGKISSLRIKKDVEKFPWAFSSSKQCRKKTKNVENYKKPEKEEKYSTV